MCLRFKLWILLLLLLVSTFKIYANYEMLGLPFSQELTRAEVEQVLGRPGFLIYTKQAIRGVPGYLDISVAGYRLSGKGQSGKLVTLMFFEDQIQLLACVFYDPKIQQKFLKRVEQLKGFEERSIENSFAYFNEKSLDLYLGPKTENGANFPPAGLGEYFVAEDFLNRKLTDDLLKSLQGMTRSPRAGLASLTYTNLRLLASIAAQTTLSSQWQRQR
ncbi:MAG: hypothetical protein ACRCVN_04485 [Spirochaetia bacterium]